MRIKEKTLKRYIQLLEKTPSQIKNIRVQRSED